jgi:hypothetical protein
MEFVNRDVNAAIRIRGFTEQRTTPAEMARAKFVGQPLRVEVYEEKLKSIPCNRSKQVAKRLQVGLSTYTLSS